MSINGRLTRLERSVAGHTTPCETCQSWALRVTWPSDEEESHAALPECCPDCGRRPLSLRVEYVDGALWFATHNGGEQ